MFFDSLDKLLEPCPRQEFLDAWRGRAFKHVRGPEGKFSALLTWPKLNETLQRHRLDYPRLRLMRDGRALPVNSYIRYTGGSMGRPKIPRLNTVSFSERLREGATLVLDAVDELDAPLQTIAETLEREFGERVQINMYAGFRTSPGFDLHWDDHDVFILQVAGRKRWQLYGETRKNPLAGERNLTPKPEGPPLWEETLRDGDLLYIPRGHWHVALPLDEPTLHLTVGVHRRTGAHLLEWLAGRVKEREAFREDLPRLASKEERISHARRIREELLAELSDDLVERCLADEDARALPRQQTSLPSIARKDSFLQSPETVLRWTPPRKVELKAENGVVEFSCLRRRWRFAEGALAVLVPLSERRTCTIAELCEEARDALDERTVRVFLRELLLNGLVAIVNE